MLAHHWLVGWGEAKSPLTNFRNCLNTRAYIRKLNLPTLKRQTYKTFQLLFDVIQQSYIGKFVYKFCQHLHAKLIKHYSAAIRRNPTKFHTKIRRENFQQIALQGRDVTLKTASSQ